MTILFVSHYSGFYGASKSMCALMLDLRARYGITPIVLMPNHGPLCAELEKAGVKYYVSHYYWWVNDNKGVFQWLLNKRKQMIDFFSSKRRVYELLKNENIDLVYTNSVTVDIGLFVAKKLKVPHIWHFRESLSQFNLSLSLSLPLSKLLLKSSENKAFIMISDYMRKFYSKLIPENRMVMVYNGVRIPGRERQINQVKDGVLKLCVTGVVSEQKNQMDAVKAVKMLKDRGYNSVRLYLLGTFKNEYKSEIERYVSNNNLEESVVIMGHCDDVDSVLDEMNVGLSTFRDEAFGRATVEYMGHKMPVIASVSGANPELVKDGVNGFLYDLHDVNTLADLMIRFVQDQHLLDVLGKKGYEMVKSSFTVEKNTDRIFEQISNAVK